MEVSVGNAGDTIEESPPSNGSNGPSAAGGGGGEASRANAIIRASEGKDAAASEVRHRLREVIAGARYRGSTVLY